MTADVHLSHKQRALIVHLLSERTIARAAEKTGISEKTARRWLKQPAFAQAVEQARQETVRVGLDRLRTSLTAAVDKLVTLLDSGNESVSLKASIALIDHGVKSIELFDIVTRLTALEQLMRGPIP